MPEQLAAVEEAGTPTQVAAPRSAERASEANDLPAALSSFIGREQELSEITGALERSRLVTLTGAPGIGKSRLALALAGAEPGAKPRPERAAFAELAAISDPELLPRALAAALRIPEVAGASITEALVATLRKRPVLLVLDNCEHLLAACAELAETLLQGCPELRVLATSRAPLGVGGELVWQVPALAVPRAGEDLGPEELLSYPAVALFRERARAVQPQWELIDEVTGAVAEVTRRLDGIPLALELAAARIETLTAAEIAERLDDRFSLLTRGSRSELPRHQTLQAAIDWSHALLSDAERALLRRLSVFVGGFALAAAEEVCTGGELERDEVLDTLTGLISKSLVVSNTLNSRGRYRMLETIRAYAAERLAEAGEQSAFEEAHACFYLALAERAEPELTGARQDGWLERLDLERENLHLAIHWSLGNGHIDWALGMVGALTLFWRVRCHFSEGRELLEAAVAAGEDEGQPSATRAKALWGAGFMALMSGDRSGAMERLEQSLALYRQLEDKAGTARALLILGNARQHGDSKAALRLLDESADLAREAGDAWCMAHALGVAGYDHAARHKLSLARPLFAEGMAVARQAEDAQGLRFCLLGLGVVALHQGEYPLARSLLEEGLALVGKLGEDYSKVWALQHLGWLALDRGDVDEAESLLEEALSSVPEVSATETRVAPVVLLARVAHARGDHARAHALFERALRYVAGPPSPTILVWMGELAADEDDAHEARRLFEEALERARAVGDDARAGQALLGLGRLARSEGELERAAALYHDALELQRKVGAAPAAAASLDAIAGLAAAAGRHRDAALLLGASDAIRARGGYARPPWEAAGYEMDIALVRDALSSEELEAARAQGARLSLQEAAAQASKGRGPRNRPATGWQSLTERQQHVARLAAEGLTNPEIAERLFISSDTVKKHLSHAFMRLGVSRRSELPRAVSRASSEATDHIGGAEETS